MRRVLPHLARWLPLLPLLRLGWGLLRQDLGILTANPVEKLIDTCGWWALACLALSLAMAPLQRATGWSGWSALKRPLGLWAFAFGCLHLLVYTGLDQGFRPSELVRDIAKRPFILLGMATWLTLLPLALTSTKGWQRRLGRNWKRLHRLAYLAALLGVLHFAWKAKVGFRDPRVLLLAVPVAALLLLRIPWPPRRPARAQ
jgi:sulfoxide reductase heme-binding subunit YedZ